MRNGSLSQLGGARGQQEVKMAWQGRRKITWHPLSLFTPNRSQSRVLGIVVPTTRKPQAPCHLALLPHPVAKVPAEI